MNTRRTNQCVSVLIGSLVLALVGGPICRGDREVTSEKVAPVAVQADLALDLPPVIELAPPMILAAGPTAEPLAAPAPAAPAKPVPVTTPPPLAKGPEGTRIAAAPTLVKAPTRLAGVSEGPRTAPTAGASTRVSNVWIDSDFRQVLADITAQTGVSLVPDQSVVGAIVSLTARELPLEECLERLCSAGGFAYLRVKDYYMIGRPDPGSPMFNRIAALRRVKLRHASAEQVKTLLPVTLAPYCTFDKTNGVLMVTAPDHLCQRVLDAIELIDSPLAQVAVEAIVFELTQDGSKQLGLDWQYAKTNLSLAGENLIGTITYDASSDIATFVDITLRAIVQDERGQVLANPRILATNGREAEIFVGQEKYFQLLNGSAVNPYYRLESIKSGVTLKVTPFVGDNGQIVLDLEPEVSDVVNDWRRAEPGLTGIEQAAQQALPVVTRRRAKTTVSIKDSQTVIIGGLLREQHRQMVEKVPLIGDVPLLGAAFRKVRDLREQKEIVILITTHLVSGARDTERAAQTSGLSRQTVSPLSAVAQQRREKKQ